MSARRPAPARRRIARWLARSRTAHAVLAAAFAWVVAATAFFGLQHGDAPTKADAVFVLSGSPTRLPVGVRLVREGYAPLLVLDRTRPYPTELERRACEHRLGLPVLCLHVEPYSTVGEAEALARLAAARGWRSVDVVTSGYHVVRARLLIRRCYRGGLRVVAAPNQPWLLPADAVLESVKLVYHELIHRGC